MTATRATVIAILSAAAAVACKSKDSPVKRTPAPTPTTPAAGSATASTPGSATTPAAAKPATPPTTPPRVKGPIPPAYRDALRLGRKLHGEKKYLEAAAAFRQALVAVPDDPRALSELSWALFLAKDLEAARVAAEAAVKVGRNNVKAASLYNLGRILEAEGANAEAANAYRESLVMRPNVTVAQHLSKVDPTARPTAAWLEIEEWGPPMTTRPATCEALGEDDGGYEGWSPGGECEVITTDVAFAPPGGAFTEVTLLTRKRSGSDEAWLAVQTADGWVLSPPFLSWGGPGTWGATGTVAHTEVITHPVLGLVLRLDVRTAENGRWEDWQTDSTSFCTPPSPGGSGALTCSSLLATSWRHSQDANDEDGGEEAVDEACAATIALEADGAIALTSKGGKTPTDCPIHVGRFAWPPSR